VKNSRRVDPSDARGLREFRSDYPEAAALLVYRGTERIDVAGVRCMPCSEFLASLKPEQALAAAMA
jgi:hypothetical protein